jgi:hypothetical protein
MTSVRVFFNLETVLAPRSTGFVAIKAYTLERNLGAA